MRLLFALLLAANLGLLALGLWGRGAVTVDPALPVQESGTSALRLLPLPPAASRTARPPGAPAVPAASAASGAGIQAASAAATPASQAAATPAGGAAAACLEWGPFPPAESRAARAALDALDPPVQVSDRTVSVTSGFWAYLAPLPGRQEQERRVAALRRAGVQDVRPVDAEGPWHGAVSLGLFRTADAAAARQAALARMGIDGVRTGPHELRSGQAAFLIRASDGAQGRRLEALRARFQGAELHPADCP